MTKEEIVSAIVRLARAANQNMCFSLDVFRAARHVRGAEPILKEAQEEIKTQSAMRSAYMTCARAVKEAMTLSSAEDCLRFYCAGACTDWAGSPGTPDDFRYFETKLTAYREALRLVVQEILRRPRECPSKLAPASLPFGQVRLALPLTITTEEHAGLHVVATRERISITGLLEAFIADVTGSARSGGSDERDYAAAWVQRRLFTWDKHCIGFGEIPEKVPTMEVDRRCAWMNRWNKAAWMHRESLQRHWQSQHSKKEEA